jgi:hypothetical protein
MSKHQAITNSKQLVNTLKKIRRKTLIRIKKLKIEIEKFEKELECLDLFIPIHTNTKLVF